jgi:hypothetical protein
MVRREPSERRWTLAGRAAVLGIVLAVLVALVGPAAGAARHPGDIIRYTLTSGSAQSARSTGRVPDIVGEPIPFGTARYFGAIAEKDHVSGVIGMAESPGGRGYWIATAHGGVFTFGHAKFHGSITTAAKAPVVAIVASRDGSGYWLACSDGAVFRFGDAKLHGSPAGHHLSSPIVAMAATPDNRGYWLTTAGGAVFHYGDAHFFGAVTDKHLRSPIVAMAATPDGLGYWLVASDGAVFRFGDAHLHGSAIGDHVDHMVAIAVTPDGGGYWLVAAGGGVFSYGDARFHGSAPSAFHKNPIVAAIADSDGGGYWLLPTSPPPPLGLPPPGKGFLAGHVTAIGDSVMLDAQPDLEADIHGIDVEAMVSRQWDDGVALAQQLKSEGRLGGIVVIDLGTNGPVTPQQFANMMSVLAGASRVVFVTIHLPPSYSWWQSVNATLEHGVPKYPRDKLADFNKLADENPQWFGPDGIHMPIGGAGAQAMAKLIKSKL